MYSKSFVSLSTAKSMSDKVILFYSSLWLGPFFCSILCFEGYWVLIFTSFWLLFVHESTKWRHLFIRLLMANQVKLLINIMGLVCAQRI